VRATALVLGLAAAVALCAQTPPDFSGVYYPVNPFGQFRGGPAAGARQQPGPPPKPTASAPLADGSTGRRPDEPSLKPEYLAKWQEISKTLVAGSSEYDFTAKCLPPGMPAVMSMFYGMEVMETKDKITFFSELNDALRRVYLDGRKPSQKVLDDPTYAGYSTGHWEGDTLVVETVAIRGDTFIEGITPHSDQMTVQERIRLLEPTLLEDRITVNDPKALTKPWETVKTYRKATRASGTDELREFACPEGLAEAK
jgi:hypothetical protein